MKETRNWNGHGIWNRSEYSRRPSQQLEALECSHLNATGPLLQYLFGFYGVILPASCFLFLSCSFSAPSPYCSLFLSRSFSAPSLYCSLFLSRRFRLPAFIALCSCLVRFRLPALPFVSVTCAEFSNAKKMMGRHNSDRSQRSRVSVSDSN